MSPAPGTQPQCVQVPEEWVWEGAGGAERSGGDARTSSRPSFPSASPSYFESVGFLLLIPIWTRFRVHS